MQRLSSIPALDSMTELPFLHCGILPFIWLRDGDAADQVLPNDVPALCHFNELLI